VDVVIQVKSYTHNCSDCIELSNYESSVTGFLFKLRIFMFCVIESATFCLQQCYNCVCVCVCMRVPVRARVLVPVRACARACVCV
jgi:hypothetical protein